MTANQEVPAEQRNQLTEIADSFRTTRRTIEESTIDFIREAILRGIYRPGQRLQQDNIAELLGVSRMPVRTALRKLETEGLVVFSAHRGTTVRMLTAEEIAEIYELRIMLETHMLTLAAKRLTPSTLAELEQSADEVRHETDSTRWITQRQLFYSRLYELAGRPRTAAMVQELRTVVGPYLVLRRVAERPDAHLVVLEYLKQGDLRGAKRWLRDHLESVSDQVQQLVRDEASVSGAEQRGAAASRRPSQAL